MPGIPMLQQTENAYAVGLKHEKILPVGEVAETGLLFHGPGCFERAMYDNHQRQRLG